jgi:MFS family permease
MSANQRGIVAAPAAAGAVPRQPGAVVSGGLAFVTALSSVAAVGGFLFGFDSGVINGAVDALADAFGTKAAATGFAVASVLLGCAVGAFLAGTLADFMGRRPTMLLNATLFLISAVITGAAGSAGVFIAGRILGGWPSAPPACWRRCTFPRSPPLACAAGWPRSSSWLSCWACSWLS